MCRPSPDHPAQALPERSNIDWSTSIALFRGRFWSTMMCDSGRYGITKYLLCTEAGRAKGAMRSPRQAKQQQHRLANGSGPEWRVQPTTGKKGRPKLHDFSAGPC